MARKRRSMPANALVAQGSVTKNAECHHGMCKKVRAKATATFLHNANEYHVSARQRSKALAALPRLLCEPGPWPPVGVTEKALHILYASFVFACIDLNPTGLRGQSHPNYEQIRQEFIRITETEAKE